MPKSSPNRKKIVQKKPHFVYENLSTTIISKEYMSVSTFLRKLVKREFGT
jgi:hypothetical protein